MSKLMMLVAAKWREFSNINPHLQSENEPSAPPSTTSEEGYSKPQRPAKEATQKTVEVCTNFFTYDFSEVRINLSRSKGFDMKKFLHPSFKIFFSILGRRF